MCIQRVTGKVTSQTVTVWLFIMQNDPDDPFLVENCKRRKGSECHKSEKKSIFMNSLTFPLIS